MQCHVCNVEVGDGQKFCHACGQSLAGVTDATQELEVFPDDGDGDDVVSDSDDVVNGGDGVISGGDDVVNGGAPPTEVVAVVGDTQTLDEVGADTAPLAATSRIKSGGPPTEPIDEVAGRSSAAAETLATPVAETIDATTEASPDATDDVDAPGRIGASLFDPETAPPDAEHEWDGGISSPDETTFGSNIGPTPTTAPDTGASPTSSAPAPTTAMPAPPLYDADADPLATGQQAAVRQTPGDAPLMQGPIQPFKLRSGFIFGILAMFATVLVSIADITDIRTDRVVDGILNRSSTLADIGTNLAVAGYIGAAAMLIGGLLHCFHLRWGAGLAGGAGLALIGWAGLTLGLAEVPIDAAERITRNPNTPGPFTLTVTRDLGYWLIVAIAALGLVVFLVSLASAGTGGRRGLNPWTAALGAVAALVVAAGPLITVAGANFDVNFGTRDLPAEFFGGRLVQVGAIVIAGVVGFLLVRSYGLGLVAGGLTIPVWLWASSLIELGDRPLGIAAGNLGSTSTSPHAVTTTGVALTVAMLILSAALAIAQHRRTSP